MKFASGKPLRRFPSDFAELLTPLGRRVLRSTVSQFRSMFKKEKTLFVLLEGMIDRDKAHDCFRLLDRHLYHLLVSESSRIPADSISSMQENYGESLQKVFRFKTAFLASRAARSYRAAEELGLLTMLKSDSFAQFGEAITGLQLVRPPSFQVICYEHGHYVGPHNDYHPEDDPDCVGFVDMHVTLCNDAVAHQFLVYEQHGHLSAIVDMNLAGGVSIYRLPFWHQVTPLVGKPGREREARRWLLLGTFDIRDSQNGNSRRRKGALA